MILEAVDTASLVRWSDSTVFRDGDAFTAEAAGESQYPVNKDINQKMVLWRGNLVALGTDAIVNSTNEALTDRSGMCGRIFQAAGPDLDYDCDISDGCRTGEAMLTKGGNLPAKTVIHTVGPRYNEKYVTAAENALHNCYRNCLRVLKENNLSTIALPCIYTERKAYPREAAAHIALRTVRRFLERYGTGVELVVLCVEKPGDVEHYSRLMPLYFPRSEAEEHQGAALLPKHTCNEIGETIIEDRKIRISTSLSGSASSAGAGAVGGAALPVPAPAPAPFTSSVAKHDSFTTMEGDPDAERREQVKKSSSTSGVMGSFFKSSSLSFNGGNKDAAASANGSGSVQVGVYERYLRRALSEDLTARLPN